MKISVITPTIRKDGLTIIRNSLSIQSLKAEDFEWLIGSPFDPEIKEAKWVVDDSWGGYWTLNRIYNKLFKVAQGELIVSWQDFITAKPDGLEKFWINYENTKSVISGVGDQFESVDRFGKPQIKIWSDPRKTKDYGSFYEINWQDAEWNYCAIPKKYIFQVGGMDEELDFLGYGGDQMQISQRMNALGIKFYIDQTNESYTIRHSRDDFGGQEQWDANHVLFNGKYKERTMELIKNNKWPCIGYL